MEELFNSPLKRLKISAYAVGISLLLLVGVAIPLKFLWGQPSMLWFIPPVQLPLICWFVLNTFKAAEEYQWKFGSTTWKVLIGCFIPFGTFIVARLILNNDNLIDTSNLRSTNNTQSYSNFIQS